MALGAGPRPIRANLNLQLWGSRLHRHASCAKPAHGGETQNRIRASAAAASLATHPLRRVEGDKHGPLSRSSLARWRCLGSQRQSCGVQHRLRKLALSRSPHRKVGSQPGHGCESNCGDAFEASRCSLPAGQPHPRTRGCEDSSRPRLRASSAPGRAALPRLLHPSPHQWPGSSARSQR